MPGGLVRAVVAVQRGANCGNTFSQGVLGRLWMPQPHGKHASRCTGRVFGKEYFASSDKSVGTIRYRQILKVMI
ncbi:MAG: hypothetical protein CSA33_08650 [Desulfobulbus propionicus]|nr:MAG: hypothetical protein CSA33_08650 [Desulfobulbus propionicus]